MGVKVKRAPFLMDFGGFLIEQSENEEWLECKEKNVRVLISALLEAIRTPRPVGDKKPVGIQINGSVICYMWRDDFFTYIGCLREKTTEFNKKYLKLIKHLNNR